MKDIKCCFIPFVLVFLTGLYDFFWFYVFIIAMVMTVSHLKINLLPKRWRVAKKSLAGSDLPVAESVDSGTPSLSAYSLSKWTFAFFISIMGHHNMKKLLIASSVMAALTMGAAHADPLTLNGGTIEFIGEITDTTCWVGVDGTSTAGTTAAVAGSSTDAGNLVLLQPVAKNLLAAAGDHAGRTNFKIAVRADIATGTEACTLGNIAVRNDDNIPTGSSVQVSKVRAIFGSALSSTNNVNNYLSPTAGTHASYNYANVDPATGYLNNLSEVTGGNGTRSFEPTLGVAPNGNATNVKLRLLNDDGTVIKVGDATSQMASNTSATVTGGTKTLLPYAVDYIAVNGAATAGMVRSFVTYDLYYE